MFEIAIYLHYQYVQVKHIRFINVFDISMCSSYRYVRDVGMFELTMHLFY